jgi:catechol 2,3-dioxygenase-like lactoylglutathione lyase family enzyme
MSELTHAKAVTFILTRDLALSRDFYQNALGLKFVINDGFADVFDLAGAALRITHIPDYVASAHPALGWEVPDIAAAARELVAAGVTMTIYEGFGQDDLGIWTAPDGIAKVAWFQDPDGNVLSLTQC